MSNMTQIELDAVSFFFVEFPEWDLERILDAHALGDERVQLWRMFKGMHPEDINSAVNDLMHLLRRTRKQGSTL